MVSSSDVDGLNEIVAAQDSLLAHLFRSEKAEDSSEVDLFLPQLF